MEAATFALGLVSDGPALESAKQLALYGQFVGDWSTQTKTLMPGGSVECSEWDVRFAWVLEGGAGSLEVTIDTSSVNFGLQIMDRVAQGETFFNVAKYPTATYKSDAIILKNGVPVRVNGKLTLLGVRKSVPLEIRSFKCMQHPLRKRELCGADVRAEFNRGDFGMSRELGNDPMVRLYIQVEAIRADALP